MTAVVVRDHGHNDRVREKLKPRTGQEIKRNSNSGEGEERKKQGRDIEMRFR
jgi:hypothetical protein